MNPSPPILCIVIIFIDCWRPLAGKLVMPRVIYYLCFIAYVGDFICAGFFT